MENFFNKKTERPKNNNYKSPWTIFVLIIFVLTLIWSFTSEGFLNEEEAILERVPISEIKNLFTEGKLKNIKVEDNKLIATLKKGDSKKFAFKNTDDSLSDLGFYNQKVDTEIEIVDTSATNFFVEILGGILPFVIIAFIIVLIMKHVSKGAGNAFSFGKSKAKLFSKENKKTNFASVAGCEEAKEELVEIVDFLKNPKKFLNIGARIPRGIMLFGAPGTGKTLLSRAVAGEADVPFFSISGSEFIEMFVGIGASRVRDLFAKAKKNAPSIIFIDEIDAVGRQRGGPGFGGGHDEREQTLNQILSEMDGFEETTNVIVMAATNRPEVLDKALLRPGRFDRRVIIDRPDLKDRLEILKVHSKGKKMSRKVNLEKISKITAGFVGADIANVINEAAIIAAKNNKKTIGQKDLEFATEKVMMGPERRSRVLTDKQKEIIAYHEAGHAVVSHVLPNCDPVHKITIISRGMSLGSTWMMPKEEQFTISKSKFEDEICSLLGGYVTEIMVFKEPTTGASNDLQRSTEIAKKMITKFGMSSLGPIVFGDQAENEFLGTFTNKRNFSEDIAKKIDQEIDKLIKKALQKTENILKKNHKILNKIAKTLLKKETLNQDQFEKFFG